MRKIYGAADISARSEAELTGFRKISWRILVRYRNIISLLILACVIIFIIFLSTTNSKIENLCTVLIPYCFEKIGQFYEKMKGAIHNY